jgi:hypothetical protein
MDDIEHILMPIKYVKLNMFIKTSDLNKFNSYMKLLSELLKSDKEIYKKI